MPLTTAQRILWGRVGAAVSRSRHDPKELTSEARKRFLERFEVQVRAEYPDLPEAEIQRRATERRKAHMLRLSARSAQIRANRKAASRGDGLAASGGRDVGANARD